MKRKHFLLAAAFVVAAAAALVSCGGGGGSNGSMSSNTSVGAPANASGVITAFGSILVNGIEYGTNSSTTVVDGDNDDAPSTLPALLVGMTVDVESGGGSNPWASFVRFRSVVRGEVDSIASDGSSMVVLGQTVVITSATSFGGSDSSGAITGDMGGTGSVKVGDYVIVYGFLECTSAAPCSSTQAVATLVYGSTTPTIYRAEGYAQAVTTDSFTINALTVDYTTSGASATYCTPSPCSISNGELVEVRSTAAPTGTIAANDLTLTATRIKAISELPVYAPLSTVSIQGLVSQLTPGSGGAETFDLRGLLVTVSSSVAATVPDLADNQLVIVSGTVASDGTVTANTITIVRFATFTIIAPMYSDTTSSITLLGVTFTVNGSTRFADWAQFVQPFNSSNFSSVLSQGNQLIVSGYSTSTGNVATRVERIPQPLVPFDEVEGIVTGDSPPSTLTVGGVLVTLNSSTTLRYPGAGATPSLTGFFNALTVNKTVVAVFGTEGATSSATLTATGAVALPNTCQWVFDLF